MTRGWQRLHAVFLLRRFAQNSRKKLQPETLIAVYRFMQDKIFSMPFLQKRLFPACR